MAKKIASKPEWLKANQVKDIYSVSGCVSEEFADYIRFWKHNEYWFLNSLRDIAEIAKADSVSLSDTKTFYYEMYEKEFYGKQWQIIETTNMFETNIALPSSKKLEGYDIVTFSTGNGAQCSPLSCNSMAESINVNSHCLLESFEKAMTIIESSVLENCEPGPMRIFAIYSLSKATQV